jgi:multicomponent Na+:H+ antiporter subunit A
MWVGPIFLAALGLVFGLAPEYLHRVLIGPAVSSALGNSTDVQWPQWHLYDRKMLLSVIAFTLGGLLFWKRSSIRRHLGGLAFPAWLTPGRLYEASLLALEAVASLQTRFFQSGQLHLYLLTVIVTTGSLLAFSFEADGIGIAGLKLWRWTDIRMYEAVIAVVIVRATVVVVCASSRLVAVVALGVVGYGVALTFLVFSAPDLAMTQFAIETLSVILIVLVLFRLPKYRRISTNGERLRDGAAALAAGGIATVLVLLVTSVDRVPRLVSFFAENSFLLAKGRNVVNVILVDFRGFDTLGEITVLAVAAVGVYALVRLRTEDHGEGADRS